MLLALPIIAAVVVSYIQFTFIGYDGYTRFQPLMWDALEDFKDIMRRRVPDWMQPISAAVRKLTLPAPIPIDNSALVTTNQTLMVPTPVEVPVSSFNDAPSGIPAWIVLFAQEIQKTHFNALCGVIMLLCLAGLCALWPFLVTRSSSSTAYTSQRECLGEWELTVANSVARPSIPPFIALDSDSELVPSDPPTTTLRHPAPAATPMSNLVDPGLSVAPNGTKPPFVARTITKSRLKPPVLGSVSPPAAASESTWEGLRIPSPVESPDGMHVDLSRHWHQEVMVIDGVPFDHPRPRVALNKYDQWDSAVRDLRSTRYESSNTQEIGIGVIYSTPSRLPATQGELLISKVPTVPRITVEEYQEPSNLSMVDGSTCTLRPLETKPSQGTPIIGRRIVDDSTEGCLSMNESTPGDFVVGNLGPSIPNPCSSSGDSTPRAIPQSTEHSEVPFGGAPDLVQIQAALRDLERSLVSASAVSAAWVRLIALRDSLVYLCSNSTTQETALDTTDAANPSPTSNMDDFSPDSSFGYDNAWAHDSEDSLNRLTSMDSARMDRNTSNEDPTNELVCSECSERLCTSSSSSTSIGGMSQLSISTEPNTPLITPSNSMPLSQPDDSARSDALPNIPRPSTDYVFEDQLSQIGSPPTQYGSPLEDRDKLDSFEEVSPSGFSPMILEDECTSNLSPESQMLQSFLDDRTYAEVAGIPSDIESARATFSLHRWRIPRPGPQRPQSNGSSPSRSGHNILDEGANSWAGYGTSTSMWARPPDPNSRGFGSRRGRRAQGV